jgi:hypothetical protein
MKPKDYIIFASLLQANFPQHYQNKNFYIEMALFEKITYALIEELKKQDPDFKVNSFLDMCGFPPD